MVSKILAVVISSKILKESSFFANYIIFYFYITTSYHSLFTKKISKCFLENTKGFYGIYNFRRNVDGNIERIGLYIYADGEEELRKFEKNEMISVISEYK